MNLPELFEEKWKESLQYKSCPEEMKESMQNAFIAGYLIGVEAGLQIIISAEGDEDE